MLKMFLNYNIFGVIRDGVQKIHILTICTFEVMICD